MRRNASLLKISAAIATSVLFFSGCTDSLKSTSLNKESFESGIIRTNELIQRFGELPAPQCSGQFKEILERLGSEVGSGYTVKILATNQPVAFSPGAKIILLSKGLIQLLLTESQAAFVVAHEISHYELHHIAEVRSRESSTNDEDSTWRKELEIAADKNALTLLSRGGYEATEAIAALQMVYHRVDNSKDRYLYPSLSERIAAIASQVTLAQRNLGPGTVNRRDFTRCRQSL